MIAFDEIARLRDRLLAVLQHAGGGPPSAPATGYPSHPRHHGGETRCSRWPRSIHHRERPTPGFAGGQRYVVRGRAGAGGVARPRPIHADPPVGDRADRAGGSLRRGTGASTGCYSHRRAAPGEPLPPRALGGASGSARTSAPPGRRSPGAPVTALELRIAPRTFGARARARSAGCTGGSADRPRCHGRRTRPAPRSAQQRRAGREDVAWVNRSPLVRPARVRSLRHRKPSTAMRVGSTA
jgi:hypothetical protein